MEIFNKGEKSLSIEINDEIGFWGINHQSVKMQLEQSPESDINLNIASLGGDVNHAFAIYNMLRSHNGKVIANIYGDAASAATLIALGADEVRMADNTFFMIHNVWTMAVGDSGELRQTADLMDKINDQIKNVYKKKTGLNKNTITSLMNNETWFTAKEAKEKGFIDVVTESTEILNRSEAVIMNSLDKDVAKKLINKINNKMEINSEQVAESVFNKVKDFFTKENKEVSEDAIKDAANAQAEEIKNAFDETLAGAEETIKALEAKVAEATETINAKSKESEELAEKVAKLEAGKTEAKGTDENPDQVKVLSADEVYENGIVNLIRKIKRI